jgi:cell wall-associated NlpC family hydrolase
VTSRPLRDAITTSPQSQVSPTRRRKAHAGLLTAIAVALLAAASATADPGSVASKQAQAQQVLGQIQQIDSQLGAAVEAYNLANVRLAKIESDQRENRHELTIAKSNLKRSQASLAARLVAAYTSPQEDSTLAVLLGATSLEDLLNRVEAINSTSNQDSRIVGEVKSFKHAVERHRLQLARAHDTQQQIVAERAAQRQHIESQLATRRQLLSSIRGEIARMKAAEAAQQRQLAAAAHARISSQPPPSTSDIAVGASAATPEGSTVAPPNVHGGVVGVAMQFLGVPYVWGGASPSGFDCSGLVMYAFAKVGISLPHSSYAQFGMGTPVSIGQLQPGDLVFFSGASHVGIYIGGGQFVHAPHTGDVVKISSLSGYYSSAFDGGRRI